MITISLDNYLGDPNLHRLADCIAVESGVPIDRITEMRIDGSHVEIDVLDFTTQETTTVHHERTP